MNAKKAKLLRKEARKLTVGQPYRSTYVRDAAGQPWRMGPECTRYVYKQLKKSA